MKNIFEKTKNRVKKLSKLKFQKEIKDNSDEILKNNKLLCEIFNKDILCDFKSWSNDQIVNKGNSDKIIKLAMWINTWMLYLHLEENFDSKKRRDYDRGDIVHINFGFNVSAELGGSHYGIIVEKNNDKSSDTVVIIPLKSEDGKLEEEDVLKKLNKNEILLGKNLIPIGNAKNNYSIAKINQIRVISKLRITKPKNDKDIVYPLCSETRNEILDKIDIEINKLFSK